MGLRQSQKSIEPMTLGNMRANGVRSLAIRCRALWCNHEAILDAGTYPDEVPVPSFSPMMVCTICGAIGADVRPNWQASLFGTNPTGPG